MVEQYSPLGGIETRVGRWAAPTMPFQGGRGGRFKLGATKEVVRSSIILILGTPIGSYIMHPTFGSLLQSVLFEPNDRILAQLVKQYVIEAVETWEKRVKPLDVGVFQDGNNMDIHLRYVLLEFGTADLLRMNVNRDTGSVVEIEGEGV